MPPHTAADIDNFAEVRQRRAQANKANLSGSAGFGNVGVKKSKPLMRVTVRFNSIHEQSRVSLARVAPDTAAATALTSEESLLAFSCNF